MLTTCRLPDRRRLRALRPPSRFRAAYGEDPVVLALLATDLPDSDALVALLKEDGRIRRALLDSMGVVPCIDCDRLDVHSHNGERARRKKIYTCANCECRWKELS